MIDTSALAIRLHGRGVQLAEADGCTVTLDLSSEAYTGRSFGRLYEAAAQRAGRRFTFHVIPALAEGVEVRVSPADEQLARELIAALEATV